MWRAAGWRIFSNFQGRGGCVPARQSLSLHLIQSWQKFRIESEVLQRMSCCGCFQACSGGLLTGLQLQLEQTVDAALMLTCSSVLGSRGGAQTSKEAIAPNKRSESKQRCSGTVYTLMLLNHSETFNQIAWKQWSQEHFLVKGCLVLTFYLLSGAVRLCHQAAVSSGVCSENLTCGRQTDRHQQGGEGEKEQTDRQTWRGGRGREQILQVLSFLYN